MCSSRYWPICYFVSKLPVMPQQTLRTVGNIEIGGGTLSLWPLNFGKFTWIRTTGFNLCALILLNVYTLQILNIWFWFRIFGRLKNETATYSKLFATLNEILLCCNIWLWLEPFPLLRYFALWIWTSYSLSIYLQFIYLLLIESGRCGVVAAWF